MYLYLETEMKYLHLCNWQHACRYAFRSGKSNVELVDSERSDIRHLVSLLTNDPTPVSAGCLLARILELFTSVLGK